MVREIKRCRLCGGELKVIYDLGRLYVSSFLQKDDKGVRAPLRLSECSACHLVQLKDEVELDDMYRQYWYRSSLNKSMTYDLKDVARSGEDHASVKAGDVVLDIGTNDGTLLTEYFTEGLVKIGFDPALNLRDRAEKNCSYFINDYFSADKYPAGVGKAKVVTAIAMFYDLPNPHKFVEDVKEVLDKDGIFIVQITDWESVLNYTMVDSICHEHLEYYKSIDIVNLMGTHDLDVCRIERNSVNGGSKRYYIAHKGSYLADNTVESILREEAKFFNSPRGNVEFFKESVNLFKKSIKKFISNFDRVYALAASTKGNTLLQVLELNHNDIIAIGEINEDKFGLYTPGTRIKIVPEQEVLDAHPELIIVLAWHFKTTFKDVLKDYLKEGYVLFPLPYPFIWKDNGGYVLVRML